MSKSQGSRSADWPCLERQVFERVRAGMACNAIDREPTIVFLRELEATARQQPDRRQTIQVIASGRRLLGDTSNPGRSDGRFAGSRGGRP